MLCPNLQSDLTNLHDRIVNDPTILTNHSKYSNYKHAVPENTKVFSSGLCCKNKRN